MLAVAGGIILAVLFFLALPFALAIFAKAFPWLLGGGVLLVALAVVSYLAQNPGEIVSLIVIIGQIALGLAVVGAVVLGVEREGLRAAKRAGEAKSK